MWKVKRMNTARIVVLAIAIGAGGADAFAARGSGDASAPAAAVARVPTVLFARSDIDSGHASNPKDLRWHCRRGCDAETTKGHQT